MNWKKLVSYGLAVLMAGCVPIVSLHPLFTKDTLVFEEKLLGTWAEQSGSRRSRGNSPAWRPAPPSVCRPSCGTRPRNATA